MIYNNILQAIGNTPIIRIRSLSEELDMHIFTKLESLNPGGSHKVRIALSMILDAEQKGVLKRGSQQTLIEPSGGNTGIGLVMAGNILGYRVILVIPDNYSSEKIKILKIYGANVILSDSKLSNNSHGELAMQLQLENPKYVMLNQQANPANPKAHREATAKEIIQDFESINLDIDFFVGGIGTGGHLTGIGEALKNKWQALGVYGVEPDECDLLKNIHCYHEIQGLSVGIIPKILNLDIIDGMVKVSKKECIDMAKKIISQESISLGISSAANLVAISKISQTVKKKSNFLTINYDGIDSYMSYF